MTIGLFNYNFIINFITIDKLSTTKKPKHQSITNHNHCCCFFDSLAISKIILEYIKSIESLIYDLIHTFMMTLSSEYIIAISCV